MPNKMSIKKLLKKIKKDVDKKEKIWYISNAAWENKQCSLKTKQNVNNESSQEKNK